MSNFEQKIEQEQPSDRSLQLKALLDGDFEVDLRNSSCEAQREEFPPPMEEGRHHELEERSPIMEEGKLLTVEDAQAKITAANKAASQLPVAIHRDLLKANLVYLWEQLATLRPPSLPNADPSGNSYPVFRPRTGMDALEHLRTQWGGWLKYFNDDRPVGEELDRDYIFQDQLSERDPKLIPALTSYFQRVNKTTTEKMHVRDLVPPKESRPKACTCEFPIL